MKKIILFLLLFIPVIVLGQVSIDLDKTYPDSTWASITIDSSIQFTPQSSVSYSEGLIYYDSDDKTLIIYNDEADVALNVGEEMYKKVRNNSGGLIADGTPVYIIGAVGQLPTIAKTDADVDTMSLFVGLATHDIEDNSNGYITIYGIVRGLDTDGSPYSETWLDGDPIYISTTLGELTNVRPSSAFVVCIGHVDYAHTNQGRLQIHPKIDWATDYRIVDSLFLNYAASVNTLVLTPTASGLVDTLETSDITEITLDTLDVNYLTVNSMINFVCPHEHIAFHDSSVTLDMSTGVWSHVTNPTNTLWTELDANDISFAGDSITIDAGFGGHYYINIGLSFSGTAADNFELALFKNNVLVDNPTMERTTGATDVGYMGLPTMLPGLVAGDDLKLMIRNTASNDDATVIAASWVMFMLHP